MKQTSFFEVEFAGKNKLTRRVFDEIKRALVHFKAWFKNGLFEVTGANELLPFEQWNFSVLGVTPGVLLSYRA